MSDLLRHSSPLCEREWTQCGLIDVTCLSFFILQHSNIHTIDHNVRIIYLFERIKINTYSKTFTQFSFLYTKLQHHFTQY